MLFFIDLIDVNPLTRPHKYLRHYEKMVQNQSFLHMIIYLTVLSYKGVL